MLTGMSNTHEMIAKAEDILWPARHATCIAQVAILFPQSSPLWDLLGETAPRNTIQDLTNHFMDDRTTDYPGTSLKSGAYSRRFHSTRIHPWTLSTRRVCWRRRRLGHSR